MVSCLVKHRDNFNFTFLYVRKYSVVGNIRFLHTNSESIKVTNEQMALKLLEVHFDRTSL